MRKFVSLILVFLVFVEMTNGQPKSARILQPASPETAGMSPERLKRIDTMINGWVERGRTNGAVALIVRNGKVIYHKGFGYNDEEKKDPVEKDDIYRIASQTKAITSIAIMMLYEEGKFLLDDPVSNYLPEFAKPVVLEKFNAADSSYTTIAAKSEITIRQLLTHTSGIGYAQIGSKEANAIYAKADLTAGFGASMDHLLAADMKKLGKLPLMHHPGEKYTYGLNTDVLGYLVEVLSGMRLDQFFQTRIFEPLGMKDTYFNVPAQKQGRVVTVFSEKNGQLQKVQTSFNRNGAFFVDYPKTGVNYFSGGAGLSSTVLDYAIFLQMLLNGGEYNGKRLLSGNTVRMITVNQLGDIDYGPNKFGLGFEIITEKGSAVLPLTAGVFHWGGAYSTTYWADPKEKLIGILYRQLSSTTHGDAANKFKVMVYSAIQD